MKKIFFLLTFVILHLSISLCYAQAPNWIWAKSEGGINSDGAYSCCTDANGNIIVVGHFMSQIITLGATTLANVHPGWEDMFIVKYDPNGNVLWAKSAGGANDDVASSCSTDAIGNIIVTGSFNSSSITFGTNTLINAGAIMMFIAKYDSNGNVVWAKKEGGTDGNVEPVDCGTDAIGNIIVTGSFNNSGFAFGIDTMINTGNGDMFIVKYDSIGNLLWAKSAGGTSNDGALGCSTDAGGNIFVTGVFKDTNITFGTTTLANAGNYDLFIVKYDSFGNELWAKSAGDSLNDLAYSCSTDANNNVIVTGDFNSANLSFGSTTLVNPGGSDIYVVKYDSNGNVLWAKSGAGNSFDGAASCSTDASGNIFVTGYFESSSLTFGTTTLTNSGSEDIFIVKYDSTGNVLWAKGAGGNSQDLATSCATDINGNIIVAGRFYSSSISFGAITVGSLGNWEMFVAKLNGTVGIEEFNSDNSINISPNPFSSQTTITFNENQNTTTIKITDILGKEIKTIHFSGKECVIEKGELERGVYFVQVTTEKKREMNKRIMIQ